MSEIYKAEEVQRESDTPPTSSDDRSMSPTPDYTHVTAHATNNALKRCLTGPINPSTGHPLRIAERYVKFVSTFRYAIILFWLVLICPLGLVAFPRFVNQTVSDFDPTVGSVSYNAYAQYHDVFDIETADTPASVVVLEQIPASEGGAIPSGTTLLNTTDSTVNDFVLEYTEYVMNLADSYNDHVAQATSTSTSTSTQVVASDEKKLYYADVDSYYGYTAIGLDMIGNAFMSPDGTTTFFQISLKLPDSKAANAMVAEIIAYGEENVPSNYVKLGFTGLKHFQLDMVDAIGNDLETVDTIIIPMAMLFLAFVLGNLPIMILPILCIAATVMFSGVIMCPISRNFPVHNFTPSVMMSLIVAMSIDYSLFLISRCAEDLAMGHSKQHAIVSMVENAGHTILASGLTLCACFLGMLLLPVSMLQSVGVGASFAILCALAVNLSLTPAILSTKWLGDFVLHPNRILSMICCNEPGNPGRTKFKVPNATSSGRKGVMKSYENSDGAVSYDLILTDETHDEPLLDADDRQSSVARSRRSHNSADSEEEYIDTQDLKASLWYKIGRFLLNPCKGTIALFGIMGLIVPVAVYFPQTTNSISFDLLLPDNSPTQVTFQTLGELFGFGMLSPYYLVFDGSQGTTPHPLDTADAFQFMHDTVSQIAQLPATPLENFAGIAVLQGSMIPYAEYELALLCGPSERCHRELLRTQAYLAEHKFNAPGDRPLGTKIAASLDVDVFSPAGVEWLLEAREILGNVTSEKYEVVLVGGSCILYDVVQDVFAAFPLMISITMLVVFILMGAFFQSIIAPLRSVITIGLTEAFVFGFSVLVYQHGILDWTGLRCLSSGTSAEISWLAPVMAFSVILGLGLDYDVFLISRIFEYREKGYNDNSAVLIGLYKTGGIITAAGIIMTLAFGGLLLSQTIALNQWACYLTGAVLLDTFLIRTVVVPILMGYTGKQSWWPKNMGDATKDVSQL